jgi:hypothetical protein
VLTAAIDAKPPRVFASIARMRSHGREGNAVLHTGQFGIVFLLLRGLRRAESNAQAPRQPPGNEPGPLFHDLIGTASRAGRSAPPPCWPRPTKAIASAPLLQFLYARQPPLVTSGIPQSGAAGPARAGRRPGNRSCALRSPAVNLGLGRKGPITRGPAAPSRGHKA